MRNNIKEKKLPWLAFIFFVAFYSNASTPVLFKEIGIDRSLIQKETKLSHPKVTRNQN